MRDFFLASAVVLTLFHTAHAEQPTGSMLNVTETHRVVTKDLPGVRPESCIATNFMYAIVMLDGNVVEALAATAAVGKEHAGSVASNSRAGANAARHILSEARQSPVIEGCRRVRDDRLGDTIWIFIKQMEAGQAAVWLPEVQRYAPAVEIDHASYIGEKSRTGGGFVTVRVKGFSKAFLSTPAWSS